MIRRLATLPPIRWLVEAWDRADERLASFYADCWQEDEE